MRKIGIGGMAVTFLLGVLAGVAGAKKQGTDPGLFLGKPPKEAAASLLTVARAQAERGSWENIAVGRVYYLSGDKARGQAIFDRVTGGAPKGSDWQRIGEVYAQAGENSRAADCFQKVVLLSPKDDTGQAEIGAWYIRTCLLYTSPSPRDS